MGMKKILFLISATVFFHGLTVAVEPTKGMSFSTKTVFEEGDHGYSTYRIPAIVRMPDGMLLAFAEARRRDRHDSGDIDLVLRRSVDGGRTWGEMIVVWDDRDNTCGNPAPVVLKNGEVVLLATWNRGEDIERDIERHRSIDTRRAFLMRSEDAGKTWTTPEEITEDVKLAGWTWYATGPCHAIVKQRPPHKGRIVVPSNHHEFGTDGVVESFSQMIYSDDNGHTWNLGAVSQSGGNESTVAELSDGSLMLNMRRFVRGETHRMWAVSRDGGVSWSASGEDPALIEPRCQGSLLNVTGRKGRPSRRLLFSNPHDARKRRNLSIGVSLDDGSTWSRFVTVFPGPSAYSDMVRIDRKHVGVLFENGDSNALYRRISFAVVPLNSCFE
jgi:sialidase-1